MKLPFEPKNFIDEIMNCKTKEFYDPGSSKLSKHIRQAKQFVEQNKDQFHGLKLDEAINRAVYLQAVGRINFK